MEKRKATPRTAAAKSGSGGAERKPPSGRSVAPVRKTAPPPSPAQPRTVQVRVAEKSPHGADTVKITLPAADDGFGFTLKVKPSRGEPEVRKAPEAPAEPAAPAAPAEPAPGKPGMTDMTDIASAAVPVPPVHNHAQEDAAMPLFSNKKKTDPRPSQTAHPAQTAPTVSSAKPAGSADPAHSERNTPAASAAPTPTAPTPAVSKPQGGVNPSLWAGAAPEKPTNKSAEKQAEKPAGKPAEKQAEKPAEKPAEKSAAKPAEKQTETPRESRPAAGAAGAASAANVPTAPNAPDAPDAARETAAPSPKPFAGTASAVEPPPSVETASAETTAAEAPESPAAPPSHRKAKGKGRHGKAAQKRRSQQAQNQTQSEQEPTNKPNEPGGTGAPCAPCAPEAPVRPDEEALAAARAAGLDASRRSRGMTGVFAIFGGKAYAETELAVPGADGSGSDLPERTDTYAQARGEAPAVIGVRRDRGDRGDLQTVNTDGIGTTGDLSMKNKNSKQAAAPAVGTAVGNAAGDPVGYAAPNTAAADDGRPPREKPGFGQVLVMLLSAGLMLFSLSPLMVGVLTPGILPPFCIGLFFFLLARFWHRIRFGESRLRDLFYGTVAAFVCIGIALMAFLAGLMYSASIRAVPNDGRSATVIVLGCKINGEQPSRMLSDRLDIAADYLLAHPDARCVVTGGQGDDEPCPEAEVMRRCLIERGVSRWRIVAETGSTSTRENIGNTAALADEYNLGGRYIVVTDRFHEYRALHIAKEYGMEAYPLCCETRWYLVMQYWFREMAAIVKMALFGG